MKILDKIKITPRAVRGVKIITDKYIFYIKKEEGGKVIWR